MNGNEEHYGKAMAAFAYGKVTIISDCISCGRFEIGPLHPLHLRTVATMLNQIADSLGLPDDPGKLVSHEPVIGDDFESVVEKGKELYEQIDVKDCKDIANSNTTSIDAALEELRGDDPWK